MLADDTPFDALVLGAGLRGLTTALRLRRDRPDCRLLVVDAEPQPGGSVRTQRTNGFVCELGPFAFPADELTPLRELLARPPQPLAALPAARTGALWNGHQLTPVAVDPEPWSFRTGNEELVQACRRELGDVLRLGRAVTTVDFDGAFAVTLGGEVPTALRAHALHVALPTRTAADLPTRFDPHLAGAAQRMTAAPTAMAFFGGDASAAPTLRGYGILPTDEVVSPVHEVVFCSEVFAGRALPGRFLVRVECAALGDDDATLDAAEHELRRWTATTAAFGLRKLHRFEREIPDGARIECRLRLAELPVRVRGLFLA